MSPDTQPTADVLTTMQTFAEQCKSEPPDFWAWVRMIEETGGPDIGDFKFGVPGVRVEE